MFSMARTKRRFTAEYRVEAAHRVIDSGRPVAEVARELGVACQRDGTTALPRGWDHRGV